MKYDIYDSTENIKIEQLDKLFKDKPDNINILLGNDWRGNIYLEMHKDVNNGAKTIISLLLDIESKQFNCLNSDDTDVFPHLKEHKNLNTLLENLSELINNNILENKRIISSSSSKVENSKQYKNIVLSGNYDKKLSEKYSLEIPNTSIKRDFFRINSMKVVVFLDTTNNTYQYYDDYMFSFDKFNEEYIQCLDRAILEENNLIERDTKLNIQYNSILDTLTNTYPEFFV